MEYKIAQSVLAKLSRHIKWLSVGMAGLLLCNAVLGLLLWHQSNRRDIILIPANLYHTAEITQQGVSSAYLDAMAVMLINDRLNLTPHNVTGSNQQLLNFVDPRYYTTFKAQLAVDAQTILQGKIASVFYVNQVQSNPKTRTVLIRGQLKRWVGKRCIGVTPKRYRLIFSRQGDVLLLTAFQEMKKDGGVKT